MRFGPIAALVMVPAVLTQTPATALPCDNTRWCAEYAPSAGGLSAPCRPRLPAASPLVRAAAVPTSQVAVPASHL